MRAISCNGFSATTIWIVEQFGLAMMPRLKCCAIASGLTSGTTSGTSGSMRKREVLSMTTAPAFAARGANTSDTLAPGEDSTMSMPRKSNVSRPWTLRRSSSPNDTSRPIDRDDAIVVSKAADPDTDAYSGFDKTGLADRLRELGVKRVFVGGLATDYCVKATVLDAVNEGFEAFVLLDASRGVDVPGGSAETAVNDMKGAGAKVVNSDELE